MKLSADLSPGWIYIKGILFLLILAVSSVLLIIVDSKLQRLPLLLLVIWSSARLYYFMFYVIEHYVDDTYKFSSITATIQYLLKQSTSSRDKEDERTGT